MGKFVLTAEIEKAIRQDGMVGCVIYGPMRIGKSVFALKTLYQLYGNWDDVLAHTVFRLEDMVGLIEQAMGKDQKVKAVLWDDAGVYGGRMRYFENRTLIQYLENLLDTIGLSLHALLMTSPSVLSLLKCLRTYEFYRIKIYRDTGQRRYAIAYMSTLLPSGTRLIHRKWRDNYTCRLPDDVWKEYLVRRQGYLREAISQLKSLAHARSRATDMEPYPDNAYPGNGHDDLIDEEV